MKNKQLDTKDLLMNKKEELIWRVIDNVINCCAVTRIDGAKSITREDVVGKSREENVDYNNIPANNTSVSYNNGNLIIAESKQTIQSEVEATLQHANYVIEHIEDYKNQITKCEEVLKELNPQFAKDKARDERIAGIENEVAGMKGDIAKILAAVTKN